MSLTPITPTLIRRADGRNVIGRSTPAERDTGRMRPVDPIVERDEVDHSAEPWLEEAVCATIDPELFFPERAGSNGYATARKICQSCPVAQQCLDDAMAYEADVSGRRYGMYGGLTPEQRSELAAERVEEHSTPRKLAA